MKQDNGAHQYFSDDGGLLFSRSIGYVLAAEKTGQSHQYHVAFGRDVKITFLHCICPHMKVVLNVFRRVGVG